MKLFCVLGGSTSNTLSQNVDIIVFGIITNAEVTPQDPCSSINCPIVVENSATYNAIVHVPNLPPVSTNVIKCNLKITNKWLIIFWL